MCGEAQSLWPPWQAPAAARELCGNFLNRAGDPRAWPGAGKETLSGLGINRKMMNTPNENPSWQNPIQFVNILIAFAHVQVHALRN